MKRYAADRKMTATRILILAGLINTLASCGKEPELASSADSNPSYSVTIAAAVLHRGDYDYATTLVERALASNDLKPRTRQLAQGIRAAAALHTAHYDLAAQALDAIASAQPAAPHDLIVVDQNIEAHPNRPEGYFARARLLLGAGRYTQATGDCDSAVGLEIAAVAIGARKEGAWKNFDEGHFQQTIEALGDNSVKVAGRPYALLALHLARAKLGRDDTEELARAVDATGETEWPAPVLAFYLNRIDQSRLFAEANNAPNKEALRGQICEANFYAGEGSSLHGDPGKDAADLLKKAQDNCPTRFVEASAARSELARLHH